MMADPVKSVRGIVAEAFLAVHGGRSTDDVVIDDELNAQFIEYCERCDLATSADELNRTLFNLRKAASLGPVASRGERLHHEGYLHAAEIGARHVEDRFGRSLDRVLCSREGRQAFDSLSQHLAPGVPAYRLRKAALMLRKRRALRPELIKRVADWGKVVRQFGAHELRTDLKLIPKCPGVYIFLDARGYLYIGEASSLRVRVGKHLDHSDRKALARYLWEEGYDGVLVEMHCFDPTSNARLASYRRAYEADLIRTRRPRLNIQV